jgi:hypothetical protein
MARISIMRVLFLLLITAPILLPGAIFTARTYTGERVMLYYFDENGREYMTPLWIARNRGDYWLRANTPDRRWLAEIRERPEIRVSRSGVVTKYEARPSPHARELVNQIFAEEYGWGEWVLGLLHDRSRSVPIRLALR